MKKNSILKKVKNIDKKKAVKYGAIGIGTTAVAFLGLGVYSILMIVKSLDDIAK